MNLKCKDFKECKNKDDDNYYQYGWVMTKDQAEIQKESYKEFNPSYI